MKENWEIHWKDYYNILQIHPLAEPEVVKAARDRLLHKYHPDHNPGKEQWANEKTKEINEAFEIISNPEKRRRYYVAYLQKPKPKATPNVNRKNELTLNEQLKLLLIIASQDQKIYFRKREWVKNISEVKKWLDKFRGGASRLGECPYCKMKYVLLNSDASVGKCVNPNCDYIIAPEYNWDNKPNTKYNPHTERNTNSTSTPHNPHSHRKDDLLGNLHEKGKYTPDNSNLNPNIAKPISNDPITIMLIIIALCITIASWYPYIMSHNEWWLFLCIPISIVCLPAAIIWFLGLKGSKPRNKSN